MVDLVHLREFAQNPPFCFGADNTTAPAFSGGRRRLPAFETR